MIFDGVRQPNTIYAASVSRGKDSTAMLLAIEKLGFPLDAIYAVDIWATQDIPAELPPMVAFKDEWDRKCLERFGIPVTRLCAMRGGRRLSYEDIFYKKVSPERERERERAANRWKKVGNTRLYGYPVTLTPWCNGYLKRSVLLDSRLCEVLGATATSNKQPQDIRLCNAPLSLVQQNPQSAHPRQPHTKPLDEGQKINIVHYIGIAADEPKRIERWQGRKDKVLPLVQIGWDEATCRKIAKDLGMLSPTYTTGERDGCWFCHNQGIKQLRRLRKEYPDLWAKLLQWDSDSPTTFHPDGRTVHDFDERFRLEDEGLIDPNERFRWSMIECPFRQMTIEDFLN